jgi:hypothetical protein
MGSKKHTLKPYGAGLGKVLSRSQYIKENVIAKDADAVGKHRYNIHGK